jgi:hypothetical protein
MLTISAVGLESFTNNAIYMDAVRSYETSDLSRATLLYIPEDDMLQSHLNKNLKSYIFLIYC